MKSKSLFRQYFDALQSKVPNYCKLATLLLLAIFLAVTIVENTTTPIRFASGIISMAIMLLLGVTATT